MELLNRIIEIVDANLIYCLIPMAFTLLMVELIFKNRFETNKALNVIRWTIIIYAITTLPITLIQWYLNPEDFAIINRSTGTYRVAYWLLTVFALVLPLTLLLKKMASKFWYIIIVAFSLKTGFYFERFVIITTSLHRDYPIENGNFALYDSIFLGIGLTFLQGIIITILLLGLFEIMQRNKTVNNKHYS